MLLTFYIADNGLYGIKIALHLIVAGAQIRAGLNSGRVKTLWKKIDAWASIRTNTVFTYTTTLGYILVIYMYEMICYNISCTSLMGG